VRDCKTALTAQTLSNVLIQYNDATVPRTEIILNQPSALGWDYFFSNYNGYAQPDGCGIISCSVASITASAIPYIIAPSLNTVTPPIKGSSATALGASTWLLKAYNDIAVGFSYDLAVTCSNDAFSNGP